MTTELAKQEVKPRIYSYNELRIATRDFHPDNKLGEGGFGVVYKVHKTKWGFRRDIVWEIIGSRNGLLSSNCGVCFVLWHDNTKVEFV